MLLKIFKIIGSGTLNIFKVSSSHIREISFFLQKNFFCKSFLKNIPLSALKYSSEFFTTPSNISTMILICKNFTKIIPQIISYWFFYYNIRKIFFYLFDRPSLLSQRSFSPVDKKQRKSRMLDFCFNELVESIDLIVTRPLIEVKSWSQHLIRE